MPDGSLQEGIGLTERAAAQLQVILDREGEAGSRLRVSVSGGGCSGFQYGFSFDKETSDDDTVYKRYGVEMVVDEVSLDLLRGSVVEWKEDLAGAMFVVENPNAASSCGCGSSFAI
jgi:iron-sulfur cluster insertion protein